MKNRLLKLALLCMVLPNKELVYMISSYFILKKLYYEHVQKLRCLYCKVPLYHQEDGNDYNISGGFDFVCLQCQRIYIGCPECCLNGDILDVYDAYNYTISGSENNMVNNIKGNQEIYLMKFLGYDGQTEDNYILQVNTINSQLANEFLIDFKESMELNDNDIQSFSLIQPSDSSEEAATIDDVIPYYVGNSNQYSTTWNSSDSYHCIVGDCGGGYHYWKCMNCYKIHTLTDK